MTQSCSKMEILHADRNHFVSNYVDLTFVASIQSYILITAEVLCEVAVVQVILSIATPSTRFGHWKDNRYKEKLEWDAFSRFLSDMTIIQKHAPADLSMWGE